MKLINFAFVAYNFFKIIDLLLNMNPINKIEAKRRYLIITINKYLLSFLKQD